MRYKTSRSSSGPACGERAIEQELHRSALSIRRDRLERRRRAATSLVARLLHAADQLGDRHQFAMALRDQRFVHLRHARIAAAQLRRAGNQHRHDPVDVPQPEVGRLDRIAAHHIGVDLRIQRGAVVLAAEAQHRIVDLLRGHLIQAAPLVVAAHRLRDRLPSTNAICVNCLYPHSIAK